MRLTSRPTESPLRQVVALVLLQWLLYGCTSETTSHTDATSTIAPGKQVAIATNQASGIHFAEVAVRSGVEWIPRNGEEAGQYTILESLGSGCAITDYDQDGRLDIFVAGGGTISPNHDLHPQPIGLFRQHEEWMFTQVAEQSGTGIARFYHHGCYTADFNNDGFPDLLLTGYGGLRLHRNQGDGTFVDVTEASQLNDASWSTAAGWGDLNRDGILDLFVGHYVNWSWENHPICQFGNTGRRIICAPSSFTGLPSSAYLGVGDGTFRDASHELGLDHVGKTLGVVISPIDGDEIEIYVGNDTAPNHLYKRTSSGVFDEVGLANGVALGDKGESDGSMGVDIGDLDADGRLDIWVANFENESFALYRNLGDDLYRHSSRVFGITAVGTLAVGFGTVIADVDGDGYQDILCVNGHIHAPDFPIDRRHFPFLFHSQRAKRFQNIAPQAGPYLQSRHLARGAASGDFDQNGTPDFVVTHINESIAILKNETAINNWIAIRLIGRRSNRSAIGSRINLTAGEQKQVKTIRGGGSYLSTNDFELLFGLGEATTVDVLEVAWPSGARQQFSDLRSQTRLTIIEPE